MLHELGCETGAEELAEKKRDALEKGGKLLKIAKGAISSNASATRGKEYHMGDSSGPRRSVIPWMPRSRRIAGGDDRVLASMTPREERVVRNACLGWAETTHGWKRAVSSFNVTRRTHPEIEAKLCARCAPEPEPEVR